MVNVKNKWALVTGAFYDMTLEDAVAKAETM